MRPDGVVGRAQFRQRRRTLLDQPGVVDGDGGVVGERGQQRHLVRGELPGPALGGEQHPDDPLAQGQRYPEDRDQPLVPHTPVDRAGVVEAVVVRVVAGGVGAGGLRDQAAQPLPRAEPELLEQRRGGPVGDPHVGAATDRVLGVVVQRQVGDVGAQQHPGPVHDRAQHRVQVAQPGEVTGRVEQRGQLGLPATVRVEGAADLQSQRDRVVVGRHAGQIRTTRTRRQQLQQPPRPVTSHRAGSGVRGGVPGSRPPTPLAHHDHADTVDGASASASEVPFVSLARYTATKVSTHPAAT